MQVYDIQTDAQRREKMVHGSPDFPCAAYDERFSAFIGHEVPWHWHEELEAVIVCEGRTLAECCSQRFPLGPGDGILINSNVLHRLTWHSREDCRIINLVFHPLLLGGTEQSLVYRRYLLPLLADEGFAALPLSPAVSWQTEALELLRRAFELRSQPEDGQPLLVQAYLLAFWQRVTANLPAEVPPRPGGQPPQDRIKKMLAYIAGHYREKLEVSQLAAAANISQSECYRCFQRCLGVSPIRYLLQYRLQKAAGLLRQTSLPVTTVCSEAGFSHPSYFARQFQLLYGCSPSAFRRQEP
ncbi:helix-turn-helix transcriptional regulator [Anaerofilum sp. BX8]|uniref:Helix-turn-helix transcriptional regulator n=1 Tax=Anaerofilum hominis TaxID=2763016 RepID=A0A923I7K5_9FIRM|nr:AraC family transcriptional regulator [Anaerofilum hominis]MBC5580256.1 helix-turn-helix transcriptional regulator [Anaerofilum hominis]